MCSPVYPEEEADDENVIDDSGTAELTLDKIEDDTVLVIFWWHFPIVITKFKCVILKFNFFTKYEMQLTVSLLLCGVFWSLCFDYYNCVSFHYTALVSNIWAVMTRGTPIIGR